MINQEKEEIQGLESSKKVRFESEGEVLTSFYTSPIEDDILQEMGLEPGFELEKHIDDPGFLINFLNTDKYKELMSEPIDKVKISPWVGMMELKDEVVNLNDNYSQKVVDLIDIGEVLKSSLELIETPDPELDTGMKLIDCKDFSETTYFSKPEPELDLIDFRDFSKLEPELIDFSDPEPKLFFFNTFIFLRSLLKIQIPSILIEG